MKAAILVLSLIASFISGFIISEAMALVGTKPFLTTWALGTGLAAVVLLSLLSCWGRRRHRDQDQDREP